LLEKISEDEIAIMECLHNPVSALECLFSSHDNLLLEDEEILAEVRNYQLSMLSYEYVIDDLPKLNKKQNFKLRENTGSIDSFGARGYGKTLYTETLDILLDLIHHDGDDVGFTAADAIHIRGVLEKVIEILENHTFFQIFNVKINRSPNYKFTCSTGWNLNSVNMNLASTNPGKNFFGHHFKKLYIEEASMEVEEVLQKRLGAMHEQGGVIRSGGMTDFTKYSPAGKRFYELANQKFVCNLPKCVAENWSESEKQKDIKKYGGEGTIGYRVFVKGEVVEEGIAVFDMTRVRANYNEEKIIKHFEIKKDNFHNFRDLIIVERPEAVDQVYIDADVGEQAPTEIIILYKNKNKYRYVYNITCYGLTDRQQFEIFDFLIKTLKAENTGIDTTDGQGRAIYRSLNQIYARENLSWCGFNEKIEVDVEKDEQGNIKFDKDGKLIPKEEFVSEWSVKILKELFYDNLIELAVDYKFDKQLNSVIAVKTANRTSYQVAGDEDHLFAAFRVFAIAHWLTEFKNLTPISTKKFSKIIV
jgi:hypothetical protein